MTLVKRYNNDNVLHDYISDSLAKVNINGRSLNQYYLFIVLEIRTHRRLRHRLWIIVYASLLNISLQQKGKQSVDLNNSIGQMVISQPTIAWLWIWILIFLTQF